MAEKYQLILPYPPSVNHYFRVWRNRVVLTSEARQYKIEAGFRAKSYGIREPLEGELIISLDVYRPRKRGDADNILKCCLDSMNKIAWKDDSQIKEIHLRRFDDKADPRVEVLIQEAS